MSCGISGAGAWACGAGCGAGAWAGFWAGFGAAAGGLGAGFGVAGAGAWAWAADAAAKLSAAMVVTSDRRAGRAVADTIRSFIINPLSRRSSALGRPRTRTPEGCLDAKYGSTVTSAARLIAGFFVGIKP